MTDEHHEVPRRARRAVEEDVEIDALDDTAAASSRGGRFLAPEDSVEDDGAEEEVERPSRRAMRSSDPIDEDEPQEDSEGDLDEPTREILTTVVPPPPRTGDEQATSQQPAVPSEHAAFLPPHRAAMPPQPVAPRGRFADDDGDDSEGPAPRRSAASSMTPPGVPAAGGMPDFAAPTKAVGPLSGGAGSTASLEQAGSTATPLPDDSIFRSKSQTTPVPSEPADAEPAPAATDAEPGAAEAEVDELSTVKEDRSPWPMRLLAGALVLALAAGAFLLVRQATHKTDKVITVSTSPSASSAAPLESVGDESLLDEQEAGQALGGDSWSVSQTLQQVDPNSPGVPCMSSAQGLPNSLATRQRVLASNTDSGLAALQRLDSYPSEALAKQAYKVRLARLSACDDIPAYLENAAEVNNLGDESFSLTVTYQDPTKQYHTIVISRTGTAVQMLDVSRNEKQMEVQKVVEASALSAGRLCKTAKGTCPASPTSRAIVVPPTPIQGWLAQSDLPRVTAGAGLWSATQVARVTTKGSQCENMTLASVTGPTAREQRAYLLDQDDSAPTGFGVDQVRFTFKDEKEAKAFAEKLGKNIEKCADRADTATVSQDKALSTTGEDRQPVQGRTFLVVQKTGEESEVQFRLAVVQSGERVTYLVSNTRKNFDFSQESWVLLAARAGQRITQSR